MSGRYGIYGLQITRPYEFEWGRIEPAFVDPPEAKRRASDRKVFHLTAQLSITTSDPDKIAFDLEAVLSFVEHAEVLIIHECLPVPTGGEGQLKKSIQIHDRPCFGGSPIATDDFFPMSRQQFIALAMTRLQAAPATDAFRSAFFKKTESFRLRNPLLDLRFFLVFSGLEAMARSSLGDRTSKAPPVLAKYLRSLGFTISQTDHTLPERATETYCHLRNAHFHNGEYSKVVDENGTSRTYRLTDYANKLDSLNSLTLMKETGFDDGHTNWDSWVDRQPFI